MQHCKRNSTRGFTLLELMIALSVGLIVIGGAVQLFSRAVNATFIVSERAQMQQDSRAAENMIIKDISQAGAGLQPGGVGLASGTGTAPTYGCDQAKCYVGGGAVPSGIAYPNKYMSWIVPGYRMGPILQAGQPATDVITVVYADTFFLLNEYAVTFNNPAGTSVTFCLPATPAVPPCPAGTPPATPPQLVSDPVYGLKTGDLILLQNTTAGSTAMAVAEITANVTGLGPTFVASLADPDSLHMNQSLATSGEVAQMTAGAGTTATRIWVVTYYVDNTTDPNHARLMRQVNGQTPVPVADNVSDLRFTYDTYDDLGNLQTGVGDIGVTSPNMIRKVNIAHLTFRTSLTGTTGFQGIDIQTSVSARNMSFKNRYN